MLLHDLHLVLETGSGRARSAWPEPGATLPAAATAATEPAGQERAGEQR
jgi:hypothetical protein